MNLSKKGTENYNGAIPPCALTNAIREFQIFNQIEPADGRLTKETIKKMADDRCGNGDAKCTTPKCLAEDRYSAPNQLRRKRYAVRQKKWKISKKGAYNVAYFYENDYNPDAKGKENHDKTMVPAVVKKEIETGFAEWTKYSGLNFIEVDNPKKANMKIRFGSGDHGEKKEKSFFDGPYGVLAHMYYPRKGQMHFDESENYTASHEKPGISLYFVAAHEMGHGLGIEHSANSKALMAPYYIGYREQMLLVDDIKAIRHLYGTGNGFVSPIDGPDIIAPEGLGMGVDVKDKEVVALPPVDGEDTGETKTDGEVKEGGKVVSDKCVTGNSVSFAQTKDLGHCVEGFTAGFTDPNEEYIYLFYNDNNYLRLESGHRGNFPKVSEPESTFAEMFISDKFPGMEGPYDAAVTDDDKKITYFFADETVTTWDWEANQIGDLNREPIENTVFAGLPDSDEIDAVAKYDQQFLFFIGENYYVFSVDDGILDPEGHPATLDGEQIASAFHSFYNGYIYTTIDSYTQNSIYNLIKAKRISKGVSSAEEFQDAVMASYGDIDMEDDTMFGWPCGLGFCGNELESLRPDKFVK